MTEIPDDMDERVARALHEVADLRSAKDCRVAWDNCLPAYREMLFVDARAALVAMQPALLAAEQRGEARERERCATHLFDRAAFMTAVSGDGDPYVKFQFKTLKEMHSFHRALCDLAAASRKGTAE